MKDSLTPRAVMSVVTVAEHNGLPRVHSLRDVKEWKIEEGSMEEGSMEEGSADRLPLSPTIGWVFQLAPGEEKWVVKVWAVGAYAYFFLWDRWKLCRAVVQKHGSRALEFFTVSGKRWVPFNPTSQPISIFEPPY